MSSVDVCVVSKDGVSSAFVENLRCRLPVNQVIVGTSKPLGIARFNAIQMVSTPSFMFVDSVRPASAHINLLQNAVFETGAFPRGTPTVAGIGQP